MSAFSRREFLGLLEGPRGPQPAPVQGTEETVPGHITDLLTDAALNYVAGAGQPFLLWLAYNAPHTPWQAAKKFPSPNTVVFFFGDDRYTCGTPGCAGKAHPWEKSIRVPTEDMAVQWMR